MWSLLVNFTFNWLYKVFFLLYRLVEVFRLLPLRFGRLINHIGEGLQKLLEVQSLSSIGILFWWIEFLCYLLDLIGFAEIYEGLADLIKFNTRPLSQWELEIAKSVYGDSIRYTLIRIDEAAFLGPKQFNLCYVSGNTINSWGYMDNALLIHELMHVWQYQHFGLVYIPRALRAYHSLENYNYGGKQQLQEIKQLGGSILQFNYEQQADILADYYRLSKRYPPRWGQANHSDLPLYEYFVQQLFKDKS